MRTKQRVLTLLGVGLLLSLSAVSVWADRVIKDGDRRPERVLRDDHRDPGYYKERGYTLDKRYQHNHYYLPRKHVIDVLPYNHYVAPHRGVNFYYHAGIWYRPYGPRFIVDLPPVGVFVPVLPPYYTTIWVGGIPYYYANNVYYVWRAEQRGYVVAEPPRESEVSVQPTQPDQLFIYPKKGQSEQLQATDRYQCHRWSADQTGFDPSQPGGNVPETQHTAKRADYQRAMKACLEARNYSVQ